MAMSRAEQAAFIAALPDRSPAGDLKQLSYKSNVSHHFDLTNKQCEAGLYVLKRTGQYLKVCLLSFVVYNVF
jgi:hypothetical protein